MACPHQYGDGLHKHVQVVGEEVPLPGLLLHEECVVCEGHRHAQQAEPRGGQADVPNLGCQDLQLLLQLRLLPAPANSQPCIDTCTTIRISVCLPDTNGHATLCVSR